MELMVWVLPCWDWWGSHIFFFSSRRRHTRFDCDWSSDVCSSDLLDEAWRWSDALRGTADLAAQDGPPVQAGISAGWRPARSEERRVGKECRPRWGPYH